MNSGFDRFTASDGADVGIYRAAPIGSGRHPGLVVFPSIFGVGDDVVGHADEIAAGGVVVVVLDPFSRSDDPGGLGEGDRERAFARLAGIDFARVNLDFRELLAALPTDPACNGRVAALGICLGGPFVFNAAADGHLAAAATWHGSRMGRLMNRASEILCPMLIEYGDADPVAPMEEIDAIRGAFADADHVSVRVFAGAGHGFSHTGWDEHDPVAMAAARPDLERMLARLRDT